MRHGRTAHNASRRLLGRLDVELDDLGRRQAEVLAVCPALAGVRRIVTSPLRRTRATAAAIAGGLGLEPETDGRWAEIDYGVYDGLPLADVPATVWQAWAQDPEWAPEGGESPAAVARRVRGACDELWGDAAGSDVAVVSHVTPIKAALTWAMGLPAGTTPNLFVEVASLHRIGPGRLGAPTVLSVNEPGGRASA